MLKIMADFETTVDPNDTRVWAWCCVNIDTAEVIQIGTKISEFIDFLSQQPCEVYFHNLKFDGEFILHYLLSNGWEHSDTKDEKTFDTLISDDGQFYSMTIYFKKFKKRYVKAVIYDSLKKLPFKVSQIAEAFGLEEKKLEIDYKAYRAPDHELTDQEKEYIVADCVIVAKALKIQFEKGLSHMTIGSDALHYFKNLISLKRFANFFRCCLMK